MATRKYELKRRAEQQRATRQRIVEATVELHQTVGGRAATIRAIADRAGVERLTVYRHFPDERSLLTACTGHYLAQNPPPDPSAWLQIADPVACFRTALTEVYAYHARTEAMMSNAERDVTTMPVLKEVLEPYFAYWNGVRDLLADKVGPADGDRDPALVGAIGHAIEFATWRSLVRGQGLDHAQGVALMTAAVGSRAHFVG